MPSDQLLLRDLQGTDFDQVFADQRDPLARHMAAFVALDPDDREAFDRKWRQMLVDDSITTRAIELGGEFVGYLISFEQQGDRQVGYWISRKFWGQGLATRGLMLFMEELGTRPLHACVVEDNFASQRVLAKCGFRAVGDRRCHANGRGGEVREILWELL